MSCARRHSTNVCPGNRVRYIVCCPQSRHGTMCRGLKQTLIAYTWWIYRILGLAEVLHQYPVDLGDVVRRQIVDRLFLTNDRWPWFTTLSWGLSGRILADSDRRRRVGQFLRYRLCWPEAQGIFGEPHSAGGHSLEVSFRQDTHVDEETSSLFFRHPGSGRQVRDTANIESLPREPHRCTRDSQAAPRNGVMRGLHRDAGRRQGSERVRRRHPRLRSKLTDGRFPPRHAMSLEESAVGDEFVLVRRGASNTSHATTAPRWSRDGGGMSGGVPKWQRGDPNLARCRTPAHARVLRPACGVGARIRSEVARGQTRLDG